MRLLALQAAVSFNFYICVKRIETCDKDLIPNFEGAVLAAVWIDFWKRGGIGVCALPIRPNRDDQTESQEA